VALQQVSPQRLDDSVRRYLTAMFSVGCSIIERRQPDAVVTTPEHRASLRRSRRRAAFF
jgi:hypothetical protein